MAVAWLWDISPQEQALKTMDSTLYSGISTALVTPFKQDKTVDFDAFERLLLMNIKGAAASVVLFGSTGESPTIEDDERREMVAFAKSLAGSKLRVIAGAGANNTKVAIAQQKAMEECGADATLHVTPYYNKPTQEGLFEHFSAIAKASTGPIILYNVPARTLSNLAPETVAKLAKSHPNIIGIKEANTDMGRLYRLIQLAKNERPDFLVLCGEDEALLPLLKFGGDGAIAVSAQLALFEMNTLQQSFNNGDENYAFAINEKIAGFFDLMFCYTNPLPLKTILASLGLIEGIFRLPLCPLLDAEKEKVLTEFQRYSFLHSLKGLLNHEHA